MHLFWAIATYLVKGVEHGIEHDLIVLEFAYIRHSQTLQQIQ